MAKYFAYDIQMTYFDIATCTQISMFKKYLGILYFELHEIALNIVTAS
jgi:hypothetical protein